MVSRGLYPRGSHSFNFQLKIVYPRARHARDENGQSTPGLDLLEAYLKKGKNLSPQQAERWAGDYPLTVLDEAIQKLSPVLNFSTPKDLVAIYPNKRKRTLDNILHDIGSTHLGFKEIRDKNLFFAEAYGITRPETSKSTTSTPNQQSSSQGNGQAQNAASANSTSQKNKTAAVSLNDPKAVKRHLKNFTPRGQGREKIVALRDEMRKLNIKDHPHAFCFLLRSMFELSAKVYCADHKSSGGPKVTDNKGNEKNLAKLLGDIVKHLTQNGKDKQKQKLLHGVSTELGKQDGLLSVTSMNQLVHNPRFSILPSDICILFGNVFMLLEEMNN